MKKQCSRTLPKPIRLFRHRGDRHKLMYVIYPDLVQFKGACKKCKFRNVIKTEAGRKSQCRLKDKDFYIKYYGIGKNVWVDTIPSALKRFPKLRQEVVSYLEGGAREFSDGVLSSSQLARQGKPFLTDGKTYYLQVKKQPDSSEGIEKPLGE